ncbi:MAG: hypothetical protein LBS71_02305 [Puniceicoccales bacterium]|jgi:peptidyl-prolyl cis-trans isomerase D|nr:hypothetical protein [Puniceicoccales bacterium]
MISFLQKVLQKHHKWLFSILLIIVTISFVFTVGSSPGIGRNTHGKLKKFFGCDLSSQKDIVQLQKEIELSAQLQQIFIRMERLESYALLSRLTVLKLANDFSIPLPNETVLKRFVERYPLFAGEDRQFNAHKYNELLEQFAKDPEQLGIFERTIANDFKIAIIEKLLMGQGYCLDTHAKSAILKESTKYSFLTAKFDASLLPEDIQYAEEELNQYFQDHGDKYKIGEQIVLNYVEFPQKSFAEQVPEPSQADLNQVYNLYQKQFRNLEEGSEELKIALKEKYKHYKTDRLAMEAADQFIYELYEKNIAHNSDELEQFIGDKKLQVRSLDAIILGKFTENEHFSQESLALASKLNSDRYYSDPIVGKNGNVCILLCKDTIPSLCPPLDSVREEVVSDFLTWKREEQFANQIKEIQTKLTKLSGITSETFSQIVTDNKGTVTGFDAEKLDNRNISKEEKETLLTLHSGCVSPPTFMGAMEAEIIFLEKREIPEAIDPVIFEQKLAALENQSKKNFHDHIIEMILDEMNIKDNREIAMQHYQSMFNLIYMQQHQNDGF